MPCISYRERLRTADQKVYDELCRGISRHEKNILISPVENMSSVIRAVNMDRPDFFFVNWLDRISWMTRLRRTSLSVNYLYDAGETERLNQRIQMLSGGMAGISSYGKALSVHDWFVKNIAYDRSGLRQPIRSPGLFSAVGPLLHKKAVCEGISKLACMLLRKNGVDASVVVGHSRSGTPHAWNAVDVNGETLYMDVTYDMGLSAHGAISHRYFLLSREAMARDHITEF